jgi:hypothetical protein
MKIKFDISIYLTWSKLMSLMILVLSFVLDWFNDKGGTVLMFAIPFVVFLITGKQYFDRGKEKDI